MTFYAVIIFVTVVLLSPVSAWADRESLELLEHHITEFANSADAEFAPQMVKRVQAYLGAATLARDNQQIAAMNRAVVQAEQLLTEARQHAHDFRNRYADMLSWRREAAHLRDYPAIRNAIGPASPSMMRNRAEREFIKTVQLDAAGDLNSAAAAAHEVIKWCKQSVAAALPMIAKMSDTLLAKMRAANGRYYAPTLYAAAVAEQEQIRAFLDGSRRTLPAHPYHLLRLADDGKQLTLKIKGWRKRKQSHEELVLRGRAERREIAAALGLAVAADDIVVDMQAEQLV
ncbi:MAG: hypothetical protein Q9M13_00105, partial [Mariprofundales bacterium]|nr:hypothetical protein [Mariprofundales bacterium]